MKIDSHQHFWSYNPHRESWITDDMSGIRRDFFPKDLEPLLRQNKFDGCIAVQANDTEAESQFLLDLAAHNDFIKGVVGWVDLTAESCEERLSFFSQNSLFKGIRYTLQKEKPDFILNPLFKRGISLLSKFNLTFDLLVLEHQLPEVIQLVKEFPAQPFVLDHMAKPQVSKGLSYDWIENIKLLSSYKNVYCKVSGFLTETEDFKWLKNNFNPFFDVVSEAFGENRLMYGSDWPVCLAAGSYADTLEIVEDYFYTQENGLFKKLMGINAEKFYHL
ncbi:amidohydrolase family protein [Salinimicrobium tongyeongense]|uniref:Amidohydrolase family protein n=1 Tax=Salinimicrobium tongyeongense TaxID=2809707 RepID=A0ABY6NUT2_9FLAO|nr:amidohydrolase family protein [Salinimicrobium tongyeongense]UZH56676.1 amidohydrolase family protein [Salinimicrobium tongyeongense]